MPVQVGDNTHRRAAVVGSAVRSGPGSQQGPHSAQVSKLGSQVQGQAAVSILHVQPGAGLQEDLQAKGAGGGCPVMLGHVRDVLLSFATTCLSCVKRWRTARAGHARSM